MQYIGVKNRARRTAQDAVYWLQETRKEDSPGCSILASRN